MGASLYASELASTSHIAHKRACPHISSLGTAANRERARSARYPEQKRAWNLVVRKEHMAACSFKSRWSCSQVCRCTPDGGDAPSASEGGLSSRYLGVIVVALLVLAAFAGFATVTAKPFATFLRENVTFTRKDFVSYSERRRLEVEAEENEAAEAARQLRQSPSGTPNSVLGGSGPPVNEQAVKDLLKLLPSI